MSNTLRTLPIPAGAAVLGVLPQLQVALTGTGPAWLPVPASDRRESARLTDELHPGAPIDDDVALVVATSGTTGVPKGAMLSPHALRASGEATHERLGGPGQWLLALPAHHVAGLQVLLRSILADTEPVVLDVSDGFRTKELVNTVAALHAPRRYTSLVPQQLARSLDDPAATEALAELDAVLIGGAPTRPQLVDRARAAGITVIRTYGMSETCGGCIYDGVPLPGALVRIESDTGGRILLGGAMIAHGYRNKPDHPAFAEPGWFRTDDAGRFHDGVLTVTGRLDGAIVVAGGLLVIPEVVEAVLADNPTVAEVVVVGVPDTERGQQVAAVVVPAPGAKPTLAGLQDHVTAELGATAAPRHLTLVSEIPMTGPGKPDRNRLREYVRSHR